MKVCIISNLFPPYVRGGAEQVVAKTVDSLRQGGHSVIVITSTPGTPEIREENGVLVYRLHPKNIFFYTNAYRYPIFLRLLWHMINMFHLGVAREVRCILKKEKPDVVHTHNLMGLSFLLPRVIRSLGLRHLHTVHDVQLVEPSGIILKQQKQWQPKTGLGVLAYRALTTWLFGSPNVVISPSQFLLNFYHERGFFSASKQVVLRNPLTVDIPIVRSPEKIGPVKYLYVGQIEHHKGILFLLHTFLASPDLSAELHIVGDGSRFQEIKKIAASDMRVRVYGRVDRSSLPELFQNMDVTIVPSLCYENSPTVIFESFAFGVPVIASNIEGVAELIREGENGIMFEAGNAKSLLEKMRWAIHHRDDLSYMGSLTHHSLEGLSRTHYVERLLALYEMVTPK